MNIWFNGAGAENVKGKDKRNLPLRHEEKKQKTFMCNRNTGRKTKQKIISHRDTEATEENNIIGKKQKTETKKT